MKIVKFVNANNQSFSLNLANADIFWSYDPENKLYINMGSIQYSFQVADGVSMSDVIAKLHKLALSAADLSEVVEVNISSWTQENLLGTVDVVKLN